MLPILIANGSHSSIGKNKSEVKKKENTYFFIRNLGFWWSLRLLRFEGIIGTWVAYMVA